MSFLDIALSKGKDASKTVLTSTTETSIIVKDGKRQIVKHLIKGLIRINSYKEAFRREFEIGHHLNHPNILSYEEFGQEENGDSYIRMANINCIPFDYYLKENPAFVAQAKDINRIINEIMDAVAYMHKEGICHLDLNPSNLLITRMQKSILLINPAFTYLNCKPTMTLGNENFIAPEMLEEGGVSDQRSDIYSIGRIIEYIFTYSYIPFAYRRIIKKATQADPVKRYQSIDEMKSAIKLYSVYDNIRRKALYIAVFLLFFFFVWFGIFADNEEETLITPVRSLDVELPEGTMLNSEGFVVPDTSMYNVIGPTPEQVEQMKIYQEQAEKIFKKEFAKKADIVLSEIYNKNNMNGNFVRFKDVSIKNMSTLDEYQKELCKKYGMDPIVGAKLAGEVISTITREKMSELEKKKEES